jgi:hypothetical protein
MATTKRGSKSKLEDAACKSTPGMRRIEIPESIVVGPNREAYSMCNLVRFTIDSHPAYTSGGKALRACVRVEQAFCLNRPEAEWPKVGDVVMLLEEDWKQLSLALENPPPMMCGRCGQPLGFGGYPISQPSLLLPYLDAVAGAKE